MDENNYETRFWMMIDSIFTNLWVYYIYFICLWYLGKWEYLMFGSFLLYWTYLSHRLSHEIWPISLVHLYHHRESGIGKDIGQFFFDIIILGGGLWYYWIPKKLLAYYLCVYISIHFINYHWFNGGSHVEHHQVLDKNFCPDIFDIVYDTKYGKIENEGHMVWNIVGWFIIFILSKKLIK